jgi:hypothetical protein
MVGKRHPTLRGSTTYPQIIYVKTYNKEVFLASWYHEIELHGYVLCKDNRPRSNYKLVRRSIPVSHRLRRNLVSMTEQLVLIARIICRVVSEPIAIVVAIVEILICLIIVSIFLLAQVFFLVKVFLPIQLFQGLSELCC